MFLSLCKQPVIATEFTESEEVDVIIRADESVDLKSHHITFK